MQQAPLRLPAVMNGTEQVVYWIPAPMSDRRPQRWNQFGAKTIGLLFIFIAILAIIYNIKWLLAKEESVAPVGVGFWAGGLVFAMGVLMIVSGFRPSRCLILSVLVMSVVTNVFNMAFIIVGALQATVLSYEPFFSLFEPRVVSEAKVAFGALYIIIGIVCFGLLLTASIMSCASLSSSSSAPHTVAYVPHDMAIRQGATATQLLVQMVSFKDETPTNADPTQTNNACSPQISLSTAPPPYSRLTDFHWTSLLATNSRQQ